LVLSTEVHTFDGGFFGQGRLRLHCTSIISCRAVTVIGPWLTERMKSVDVNYLLSYLVVIVSVRGEDP
jgi:hypothetical protein